MFDSLSRRLQGIFSSLRGEVRLTPETVEIALREIRLALLEADVNFRVVKAFIDRVRDRAIDVAVLDSLTPTQQVVGIVRDELLVLLGEGQGGLSDTGDSPQVVILFGLQGAGKTTTCAKLGRMLVQQGRHPLLVSTDVRRPAAIRQLAVLCDRAGLRAHDPTGNQDPVERAQSSVVHARNSGFDVVLVDTAGRLHVDDGLMNELNAIRTAVEPADRLFVADGMTGQDAILSAGEFHRRVGVTGIVLTKMDGDARGGAALSIVSVVGVPILFNGIGEGLGDLEIFRPERLVSRMLGMGDILTLVERAEEVAAREDVAVLEQNTGSGHFTLEDLRKQMDTLRRMGGIEKVIGMLPGMAGAIGTPAELDGGNWSRTAAIIDSMTPHERRRPATINGARRKRIARGSGTTVEEVNGLLKQFTKMRKALKRLSGVSRKGKKGRGVFPFGGLTSRQMLQ